MTDLYLKFTDQSEALSVMQSFTHTDEDGNIFLGQGGHKWALWVVDQIPQTDGYHVNLRVIDPELDVLALEPYTVTPKNPVCVWA